MVMQIKRAFGTLRYLFSDTGDQLKDVGGVAIFCTVFVLALPVSLLFLWMVSATLDSGDSVGSCDDW